MYVFWRLLLAHLIAEFPLQFDVIYRLKIMKTTGIWLHSFIFFLVATVLLIPWWSEWQFWVFLFFLFISHYVLDKFKINLSRKYQVDNLGIFVGDQLAHIGLLSLVLLIDLDETFRLNLPPSLNSISFLYQDNQIVLILIGYLFASFGGAFLVYYLEKMFFPSRNERGFLTTAEKYYTIFGGLLITTFAWLKGYFFLIIPLVPISQWYLFSLRKSERDQGPTIFALITNAVVATSVGILLRFIPGTIT
ncbi:MAG: DUF3307 domain-containing protein [bacterium]|nr:DUF3307 domain-containing protein [bacterium]